MKPIVEAGTRAGKKPLIDRMAFLIIAWAGLVFLGSFAAGLGRPDSGLAVSLALRIKELMARRFVVYLRLLKADDTARLARMARQDGTVFGDDQTLLGKEWPELQRYIAIFDSRSFPAFPAGEGEYLAPDRYFLMGDNRNNSLDFRFSHGPSAIPESQEYGSSPYSRPRAFDSNDPFSIRYLSMIDQHSLPRGRILGAVVARGGRGR